MRRLFLLSLLWIHASAFGARPNCALSTACEGDSTPAACAIPTISNLPLVEDYLHFSERVLMPVLLEKYFTRIGLFKKHVKLKFDRRSKTVVIETPVGVYYVSFVSSMIREYPTEGLPYAVFRKDGRMTSRVAFCLDGWGERIDRMQYRIRDMFTADPYLSAHQLTPGTTLAEVMPSYLQSDSINGVLALTSPKRALVDAPGIGKTVETALFVREAAPVLKARTPLVWKFFPKILNTVENSDVLVDNRDAFKAVLGLTRVNSLFDRQKTGRLETFDPEAQGTFITRTGYWNHRQQIIDTIRHDVQRGQPWIIIVDEAQHRGRRFGQYHSLIEDLDPYLGNGVLLLDASGTYFHRELKSLVKLVDGNVYGGNLSFEEQAILRSGEEGERLARLQFYRTTDQGYLSPLLALHIVRQVGGKSAIDLIRKSVVFDKNRRSIKSARAPKELMDDLDRRVRRMRVPGMADRGIFFCGSIAEVKAYSKAFGERIDGEVRVYYRGEDVSDDAIEWFNNKGRYDTPEERAKHKYIFVMRLLVEGKNVNANLAVTLKDYTDDMYGFGQMLQNVARCDRLAPFKPGWRFLDYSTKARWLFDGLEHLMAQPLDDETLAMIEGDLPPQHGPVRFRPGVTVDDEWMTGAAFRARVHDIFGEPTTFLTRFPFYNPAVFYDGAWGCIRDHSAELGIQNLQGSFMVRTFIERLLARFPQELDNSDLVESLLSDDWGWTETDGSTISRASSSERLYNAIYEMAKYLKTYGYLPEIALEKIHTYEEFEKLFKFLCPDLRSLANKSEIETFLDEKKGSFNLIVSEARRWGILNPTYPVGLKDFFSRLIARLPETDETKQLLEEIGDDEFWLWAANDGVLDRNLRYDLEKLDDPLSYRRGMHRGYQRLYRAIYRIAYLFNQAYPERAIDLSTIHTFETFKRLLDETTPVRAVAEAPITPATVTAYVEAVMPVIKDRYSTFEDPSPGFARDFGMRKLILAMVGFLDEGEEREKLVTAFSDPSIWAFKANDGAKFSEGVTRRADLFHRATVIIAAVAKEQTGIEVTDEELKTYNGLTKLFDLLQHREVFHILTDEEVTAMLADDTYCNALYKEAVRRGERQLENANGLKRILVSMARDIGARDVRVELTDSFQNNKLWDWKTTDYAMLCRIKMPDLLRKADRAFQLIAKRCQISVKPPLHFNEESFAEFNRRLAP